MNAWWAEAGTVAVVAILVIAGFGFQVARAGKPPLGLGLLDHRLFFSSIQNFAWHASSVDLFVDSDLDFGAFRKGSVLQRHNSLDDNAVQFACGGRGGCSILREADRIYIPVVAFR